MANHKLVNFPAMIIHHIRKHKWSMGGLISLIVKNQNIEIGDGKKMEGTKITKSTFDNLISERTFDQAAVEKTLANKRAKE